MILETVIPTWPLVGIIVLGMLPTTVAVVALCWLYIRQRKV